MEILKITEFADPVCTWCRGSAPITRALKYRYGKAVEIRYVMTGMIDDIRTFSNRRLEIGGEDIALSNRNMLLNWIEASKVHGMPVMEHGFHLFSEEHRSTAPQCMAYIAAKLCLPVDSNGARNLDRADRYLRRVQEATAVDGLITADKRVLADLAAVEGYDPQRFTEVLNSREVQRAFEKDREFAAHYAVQSTPTYLLEYRNQEKLLQGFTTFDTLVHNIERLTYGKVKPRSTAEDGRERLTPTVENVRNFIAHYNSVYPVEIATAFCLERHSGHTALNIESYEHLPSLVDELIRGGEVAITPCGNGFKIYEIKDGRTRTQEREHKYAGTF